MKSVKIKDNDEMKNTHKMQILEKYILNFVIFIYAI